MTGTAVALDVEAVDAALAPLVPGSITRGECLEAFMAPTCAFPFLFFTQKRKQQSKHGRNETRLHSFFHGSKMKKDQRS